MGSDIDISQTKLSLFENGFSGFLGNTPNIDIFCILTFDSTNIIDTGVVFLGGKSPLYQCLFASSTMFKEVPQITICPLHHTALRRALDEHIPAIHTLSQSCIPGPEQTHSLLRGKSSACPNNNNQAQPKTTKQLSHVVP